MNRVALRETLRVLRAFVVEYLGGAPEMFVKENA
jgi:hypothetical protein